MAGANSQLISKGVQDESLTDKPMITFFESVYQQYVDFALEHHESQFRGPVSFERKATTELDRTGDMITNMLLEVTLPAVQVSSNVVGADPTFNWVPNIGQTMIKNAILQVGNQEVDRKFGLWMNVWGDLTISESKREAYLDLIGQQLKEESIAYVGGQGTATFKYNGLQTPKASHAQTKVYVPIRFWFDDPGLALPIIAMPFAPVKLTIEFRTYSELYVLSADVQAANADTTYASQDIVDATLYVEHVYVDNIERQRIVDMPHEYLITQTQFPGEQPITQNTTKATISLFLNHPVKALYWFIQRDAAVAAGQRDWTNYLDANGLNPVVTAQLNVNNGVRFTARDGKYFSRWQPMYRHTRANVSKGLNMYAFGLWIEDIQPTGALNFSRVGEPKLILELTAATTAAGQAQIYYFAENINTFRVANGTAGLGFTA